MLISAGQQDPGQRRERARLVGQHQTRDQVSTVTGCDHRSISDQSIQDVRQAHRCDDHAQSFAIHPTLASEHELSLSSLGKRSEGGRRQQGIFRDGRSHHVGQLLKRDTNRLGSIMINTIGNHCDGVDVVCS